MLHYTQGEDFTLELPLENSSSDFDAFYLAINSKCNIPISGSAMPYYILLPKENDESQYKERFSKFTIIEDDFHTNISGVGEYEFEYEIWEVNRDNIVLDKLLKKGKLIIHVYTQNIWQQPIDVGFKFTTPT